MVLIRGSSQLGQRLCRRRLFFRRSTSCVRIRSVRNVEVRMELAALDALVQDCCDLFAPLTNGNAGCRFGTEHRDAHIICKDRLQQRTRPCIQ